MVLEGECLNSPGVGKPIHMMAGDFLLAPLVAGHAAAPGIKKGDKSGQIHSPPRLKFALCTLRGGALELSAQRLPVRPWIKRRIGQPVEAVGGDLFPAGLADYPVSMIGIGAIIAASTIAVGVGGTPPGRHDPVGVAGEAQQRDIVGLKVDGSRPIGHGGGVPASQA